MFKFVVFAALLAFASAKPKPLVVEYEYPVHEYAAYSAPVAYSHSAHYDYLPYSAYTAYDYPAYYSHYDYLRR